MHYEDFLNGIVVSYTYLEYFVSCFFFKKKNLYIEDLFMLKMVTSLDIFAYNELQCMQNFTFYTFYVSN